MSERDAFKSIKSGKHIRGGWSLGCSGRQFRKVLQFINPVVIKANQDRKNIFLEKVMRPHDNDKVKKIDTIIEPLCKELKEKRDICL